MTDTPTSSFVGVQTYREKPPDVEAIQFQGVPPDGTNVEDLIGWARSDKVHLTVVVNRDDDSIHLRVSTPEHEFTVYPGQWLLRDEEGEFHAVDDDQFRMVYQGVDG